MKEETNFALIVVGIIAVVAIVGMLNFNNFTGKATGQQTKSEVVDEKTGNVYFCAPDCNAKCGKATCIGIKTRAGVGEEVSYCPNNLNYDAEGTYYMHYFCG